MAQERRWTVVLIVEDDSDGQALRELAQRLDLPVRLDWLPANGIGNIKRRGEKMIELARERIQGVTGCVAVLLDRDGRDVGRDDPHRTIQRLCERAGAPLILAIEALEAWLLADAACSAWLDVRRPANADALPRPKETVERAYYRRTRRPYTRRARTILAKHADGSGPERSPSLRLALDRLRASTDMT